MNQRRFTQQTDERDFALLHLSLGTPNQRELDWLQLQGVSRAALAEPWPIGCCSVTFDGRYFEPSEHGERALTFAAIDSGNVIDIAAWQPRTNELASYLGRAFCLGFDDIFNPASYFGGGGLFVHENPLSWLVSNRNGIVILRPNLAYSYLAERDRLVVANPTFGERLMGWLQPPEPTVEILVIEEELAA